MGGNVSGPNKPKPSIDHLTWADESIYIAIRKDIPREIGVVEWIDLHRLIPVQLWTSQSQSTLPNLKKMETAIMA
jgi:hypothetical protein